MKNLATLSFLLFFSVGVNAQTDKKNNSKAPVSSVVSTKTDSVKATQKTASFIEGTIPTPEEQGFVKKIVDGKEIYIKEAPGIQIQYQPK
jgi:hypothetical protein